MIYDDYSDKEANYYRLKYPWEYEETKHCMKSEDTQCRILRGQVYEFQKRWCGRTIEEVNRLMEEAA